jgi:hypothetical protein
MAQNYKHIKENLTNQEIEERVIELAVTLDLVKDNTVPDEVAHQLVLDVQLLDALERSGVDMAARREIEQWAVFAEARDARRFAREVVNTRKGYRARVEQTDSTRWTVVLRNRSDLRPETIGRMTTSTRALAHMHNGDYDGFEATILKKPSTNLEHIMGDDFTADELGGCGISKRPGFEPHPYSA